MQISDSASSYDEEGLTGKWSHKARIVQSLAVQVEFLRTARGARDERDQTGPRDPGTNI